MRATVEPLEGNKVKLSVEVDEAELEPAIEDAFKQLARDVRIPGFRPGKVPRRVLEARVGGSYARQQALQNMVPNYYMRAVREKDVDVIAQPEINITGGEESGDISFEATVEVRPTIELEGYGGIRVSVPSPAVDDEDIDRAIDRLRSAGATLHDVERPATTGDMVTIDLLATRRHGDHDDTLEDLTDFAYDLGSGSLPKEVEAALEGASAGDDVEFDGEADDHGHADDEEHDHDHGPVHFKIAVKKVQEKELPVLDDAWVADNSEFETVDELREDYAKRLSAIKRVQAVMAFHQETTKALAELVTDDPPDALVDGEVERRVRELAVDLQGRGANIEQFLEATGQTGPELVDRLREASIPAVKGDMALRAVADAERVEIDDDDIDKEIDRIAAEMNQPPALVRATLDREDGLRGVRVGLRKAKALDWLLEHVEVVDLEGNAVDRALLRPPEAEEEEVEADEVEDDE